MVQRTVNFAIIFMLVSLAQVDAQLKFEKRYSFSLGPNVTVAKFSQDYTLLAVLRKGVSSVFSYNPMTF